MPNAGPQAEPLRGTNYRLAGEILYLCYGTEPPSSEQWDRLLSEVRRHLKTHPHLRALIRTGTVGPSARRRSDVNELVRSANATVRVAVMSASPAVRGIVTALSWANVLAIRSFQPRDLAGALAFLEVDPSRQGEASRILEELSLRV